MYVRTNHVCLFDNCMKYSIFTDAVCVNVRVCVCVCVCVCLCMCKNITRSHMNQTIEPRSSIFESFMNVVVANHK